jgi:hypothetical protein
MKDASESKKKLQCARCRPRRRSELAPAASLNISVASQRWPLSWPSRASVVFSPTPPTVIAGSAGYLARLSIRTRLES